MLNLRLSLCGIMGAKVRGKGRPLNQQIDLKIAHVSRSCSQVRVMLAAAKEELFAIDDVVNKVIDDGDQSEHSP